MASSGLYELATETAERLRTSLPTELRNPAVGIICGSGLGGLADAVHLAPKHEIDYSRIPHFPRPTGAYLRGGEQLIIFETVTDNALLSSTRPRWEACIWSDRTGKNTSSIHDG